MTEKLDRDQRPDESPQIQEIINKQEYRNTRLGAYYYDSYGVNEDPITANVSAKVGWGPGWSEFSPTGPQLVQVTSVGNENSDPNITVGERYHLWRTPHGWAGSYGKGAQGTDISVPELIPDFGEAQTIEDKAAD